MLIEKLITIASSAPQKNLFTWLGEDGHEQIKMTAIEVLQRAYGVAEHLRGQNIQKGDRLLLCYIPSLDVIPAFVACLMIGALPVPIPPPNLQNLSHELPILKNFVASCSPVAVLTHTEYAKARRLTQVLTFFKGHSWPDLPWITTDNITPLDSPKSPLPSISLDEVAFLQYTSGSTSFPKGVMITHGNLQHQFDWYEKYCQFTSSSCLVAWVPYFHDYCLIVGILNVIYGHGSLVLMSPLTFLKKPSLWFSSLSRYHATHTAGPNFGYELVLKKSSHEEIKSWDLSSILIMQNSSEPVRYQTVQNIRETFRACGLKSDAVQASYGLAEHTVGVTFNGQKAILISQNQAAKGVIKVIPSDSANSGMLVMSCGGKTGDMEFRIVDPKTFIEKPELTVGEIWVDSPSKAKGYYGLPDESKTTFCAELAETNSNNISRQYLRTGDLGFVYEGELYVIGRLKDLIIIRGRNVYPHDIENTVRNCDINIRPGGVVAFSVDVENEEHLVLMVESRDPKKVNPHLIAKSVFQAVSTSHNILCWAVVVGEPGSVPMTTSGKVKRKATKEAFLKGLTPQPIKLNDLGGEFSLKPPTAQQIQRPVLLASDIPQDPNYRKTLRILTSYFGNKSRTTKIRAFHNTSITAVGTLTIPSNLSLPPNRMFVPGTQYPILARFANGVQDDDACIDNRSATLRILNPENPQDMTQSAMDLLFTTGPCFFVNSAQALAAWFMNPIQQQQLAKQNPHWVLNSWRSFKEPLHYASYFYYSKAPYQFGSEDNVSGFMRFRLVNAARVDQGEVEPKAELPPEFFGRAPGDTRSKTFMQDKFKEDVLKEGLRFYIQAQVYPVEDVVSKDEVLDATKPWPNKYPWEDCGEIFLKNILPNEEAQRLAFSPHNTHPDFPVPVATTDSETASLGHSRALTYHIASVMRTSQSLPPELQEWLQPPSVPSTRPSNASSNPMKVAVIGGGVSGLTAAYELQKRGHQVTVFEKADTLGGKSRSVEFGGKKYDLGAHFCSDVCESVKALAAELGLELEKTTPVFTYDLDAKQVVTPNIDASAYKKEYQTFSELKQTYFNNLHKPVMSQYGKTLHEPVQQWFDKHKLNSIRSLITESYTSSGYGHFEDENLAALYVVKFLCMGILETAIPSFWTIKEGFGTLWNSVASKLKNVVVGASDLKVSRTQNGVLVSYKQESQLFDKLVVAAPLHKIPEFLDCSEDEKDIASRIICYDYWTVVCRLNNVPGMGLYMVKQHCNDLPREQTLGHCAAFHNRYPDDNIFTCYSYATPSMTQEDILNYLRQDIEKMGGSVAEVLGVYKWDYFPHFRPEDLKNGIYERFDKLQGHNNTIYLGSIFNFELVECNTTHAQAIVKRITGEAENAHLDLSVRTFKTLSNVVNEKERVLKFTKEQLFQHVRKVVAAELQFPEGGILETTQFSELGIDSLRAMQLTEALSTNLGIRLTAAQFFEYPHLGNFVGFVMKELHKDDTSSAEDIGTFQHVQNVVFHETQGVGLLLDVFIPASSNGFAILDVVSSRWESPRSALNHRMVQGIYQAYCSKGFTVFAVRPGNFALPSLCDHIKEAIRWIGDHKQDYHIEPHIIGLSGLSAGGHLALLTALDASIESCFVGGVVAYAPVCNLLMTNDSEVDFLFQVKRGQELPPREKVREYSPIHILDQLGQREIPPVLMFHAEKDPETSFEFSQGFVEKMKKRGSLAEIIVKDSDQHEWNGMHKDAEDAAQWMSECLQTKKKHIQQLDRIATSVQFWTPPQTWAIKYASRNRGIYGIGGTWNTYDLSYVAQMVDDGKLMFPEALKIIQEYAVNDSIPRSRDPNCNLIQALAIAVALDNMKRQGHEVSDKAIEQAFKIVLREAESSKQPYPSRSFIGNTLYVGVMSRMSGLFLASGYASRLSPQQQHYLESVSKTFTRPLDEVFELMLDFKYVSFCEFLPEQKLKDPRVKEYVRSFWPKSMPGQTTAFLAKYYGVTKDEFALHILKDLMKRPLNGLAPHTQAATITLSFYFLSTTNFPIREFFAEEVALFEHATRKGMGVLGYLDSHPDMDADMTSLANIARVKLGLPLAVPSRHFDQWWSETEKCYMDAGMIMYIPEHNTHVLEAVLKASDSTAEERMLAWKRTIGSLRNVESIHGIAHNSIFYTWWSIILVFSQFSREFPEAPTDWHHKTLDWLLQCQTPSGGFFRNPFKQPNVQETAFALLAFKSALRSNDPYMAIVRPQLETAALKAEQFIRDNWTEDTVCTEESWIGVLSLTSDLMSTAIIVASLY